MNFYEIYKKIKPLLKESGKISKFYFNSKLKIHNKIDESPVTNADIEIDKLISSNLSKIIPNTPVISEENLENKKVKNKSFWLVDPIDGTKAFIKKNTEFTINIGLIIDGKPVFGAILHPMEDNYYIGYQKTFLKNDQKIEIKRNTEKTSITSKFYKTNGKTMLFIKNSNVIKNIEMSSSLKMCKIAEGIADFYPRFGNTYEWDTAAGHAIIISAGGNIYNLDNSVSSINKINKNNSNILQYNKPSFLNNNFIAII